ncbi:MAG: protein phosphatase 2C domain-containing protein [Akkermansia sp.]
MNAQQSGFRYASKQWIGHRPHQEDAADFLTMADGSLLALLADGMGGHLAGDIASREVIQHFAKSFISSATNPALSIPQRLEQALNAANQHLRTIQSGNQIGNSGTTLIAVLLQGNQFWWASVGDSLLLLWEQGKNIIRLNEDHSMRPIADEQWAKGEISYSYALRQRSILRSAIMGDPIPLTDIPQSPTYLKTGDYLFLASDGLDEWIEDLRQTDLEKMKIAANQSLQALLELIKAQVDTLDISYADNGTISIICQDA